MHEQTLSLVTMCERDEVNRMREVQNNRDKGPIIRKYKECRAEAISVKTF